MVSLPRNSLGEARLIGCVPALYQRLMGMVKPETHRAKK
jgi:hypothetical protein